MKKNCYIFLLLIVLVSCGPGRYIVTRNNHCEVYDPEPVAGQVIDWEGECENGNASGYGVLSVYEQDKIVFQCTGSMSNGCFEGEVLFVVLKDEKPYAEYLENWKNGRSTLRVQNVSLRKYLAPAKDARDYLHRLKLFQQKYPDVWVDDFHDVLLKKTYFACSDIIAEENPVSKAEVRTPPGEAINPDDASRKTIRKNELLLKISDDGNPDCGFYTIFNHRIDSLKKMVSDRYRPGGAQLHVVQSDSVCDEKSIPEKLPDSWPVERREEKAEGMNQEQNGALYFYPIKRY